MNEENFDHLETVYIQLSCPDISIYWPIVKQNHVANKTAAFSETISPAVSQEEFEAYQKNFALSKKEEELQQLIFDQVAGKNAKTV